LSYSAQRFTFRITRKATLVYRLLQKFQKVFDSTRDDLKFHITTGRTLGEYDAVSHLIKMQGFELPLPNKVIAKNGGDQYMKTGTDADFYRRGIFPFRYDVTNQQKDADLKALIGWDGPKIKARLKQIFEEHNLRIVEADSENSVSDYGSRSLFSSGKLRYEKDSVQLRGGMKPTADWAVGLRNDGNSKIFITFPYDMDFCPERRGVWNSINEKIRNLFDEIGTNGVHSYVKQYDNECGGRPYKVYEPLVDKNLREGVRKVQEHGLTKLYDTKQAVKRAIKKTMTS